MSRLITPSVIGAVEWLRAAPDKINDKGVNWRTQARIDLENQLGRVPWSEANSNKLSFVLGHKFEDTVYAYAHKDQVDGGSEHFNWFVDKCKGGIFQKKSKRIITLDGVEYCLYGKLDVWFPDRILDIKTTRRYKGQQGYLDSFQHIMYCFNENIMDFEYLIAEFEDKDEKPKILEHHEIKFHAESRDYLRERVESAVKSFVKFISSDQKLFELYTTKFTQY